jgi:putative ABC transport system permease protein
VINLAEDCVAQGHCEPGTVIPYQVGPVAAATPELLALARAESAADDLAEGRAVVLSHEPMTASTMTVSVATDPESNETVQTLTLPVRILDVDVPGGTLPQAFLPDATIRELGLVPSSDEPEYGATSYIVQFDRPVTDVELDRVRQAAATFPDTMAVSLSAPERPGAEFRMVLIALVLLFALSVTGIAIALGEAESRPEQRSLLALGADPRLRRRIAAARAAVLALLAGVLAVPAGLLPIWGIFASRGSPLAVPALEIVGAVLALPILAVASSWLLSRPLPDWSAFRGVGAGQ